MDGKLNAQHVCQGATGISRFLCVPSSGAFNMRTSYLNGKIVILCHFKRSHHHEHLSVYIYIHIHTHVYVYVYMYIDAEILLNIDPVADDILTEIRLRLVVINQATIS